MTEKLRNEGNTLQKEDMDYVKLGSSNSALLVSNLDQSHIQVLIYKLIHVEGPHVSKVLSQLQLQSDAFNLEKISESYELYIKNANQRGFKNGVSLLDFGIAGFGEHMNNDTISVLLASTMLTTQDIDIINNNEYIGKDMVLTYYTITSSGEFILNDSGIAFYKSSLRQSLVLFYDLFAQHDSSPASSQLLKEYRHRLSDISQIQNQRDIYDLYMYPINPDISENNNQIIDGLLDMQHVIGLARGLRHIKTRINSRFVDYKPQTDVGKEILLQIDTKFIGSHTDNDTLLQSDFGLQGFHAYCIDKLLAPGGFFDHLDIKNKNGEKAIPSADWFSVSKDTITWDIQNVSLRGTLVNLKGRIKSLRSIMMKLMSDPNYDHISFYQDIIAQSIEPVQLEKQDFHGLIYQQVVMSGEKTKRENHTHIANLLGDSGEIHDLLAKTNFIENIHYFCAILRIFFEDCARRENISRIGIKGWKNHLLFQTFFGNQVLFQDVSYILSQIIGSEDQDKLKSIFDKIQKSLNELKENAKTDPEFHDMKIIAVVIDAKESGEENMEGEIQVNGGKLADIGFAKHNFYTAKKIFDTIGRIYATLPIEFLDIYSRLGLDLFEEGLDTYTITVYNTYPEFKYLFADQNINKRFCAGLDVLFECMPTFAQEFIQFADKYGYKQRTDALFPWIEKEFSIKKENFPDAIDTFIDTVFGKVYMIIKGQLLDGKSKKLHKVISEDNILLGYESIKMKDKYKNFFDAFPKTQPEV